jgi:hypothetical protein
MTKEQFLSRFKEYLDQLNFLQKRAALLATIHRELDQRVKNGTK